MSNLPAPSEAVFYAEGPQGQAGPMSSEQLLAEVAAGRLPDNVQIWWPEAPGWTQLDAEPELAGRLSVMRSPKRTPPSVSDDELDKVFGDLVRGSWKYHNLVADTSRVDDVLLGALITATLDTGRVLIDLTSDGTNHFLRFEDPTDRDRITMAVTHLSRDVTTAKAVGQRASLVVGYGEMIRSFGKVWSAMRQEAKSGYLGRAEPGIVTFDADTESQYLYAQIDLYLDIDEYIDDELQPDYDKLGKMVAATANALRKFLHGRIED